MNNPAELISKAQEMLREQPRGDMVTVTRAMVEALIASHVRFQAEAAAESRRLMVFAPRRRGEHSTTMTRAGVVMVNRDRTWTIKLDVLPVDGELHVRAPLGGEVA